MKATKLLVLGASALMLLTGCGGTSSTPVGPTTEQTPSTPIYKNEAERLEVKDDILYGNRFEGVLGSSNYKMKADAAAAITETFTGTIYSGGDGNYASVYIVTKEGYKAYIHGAKKDGAMDELKVGAKIKVLTGEVAAYNGLPQIASFTYELISASENTDEEAASIKALYGEETIASLKDSAGKVLPEKLFKPVLIKNLVLVAKVTDDDMYFTPLAEIDNPKASKIEFRRLGGRATADKKTYITGAIFDIYGTVTSYNQNVQLFGAAIDAKRKFQPIVAQKADTLTAKQKIATNKLATEIGLASSYTYDYSKTNPVATTYTLPSTLYSAKAVFLSSDETVASFTSKDIIDGMPEAGQITTLSFDVMAAKPAENITKSVKITRKICVGTETIDECKAAAAGETVDVTEYSVDVNHLATEPREASLDQTFLGEKFPTGKFNNNWKYQTNNEKYPNPSMEKDGLVMNYALGGVITPKLEDSTKVDIELALKSKQFKEGADYGIIVKGFDADGKLLVTSDEVKLDASKLGTSLVESTLQASVSAPQGKKIVQIIIEVSTGNNATVYFTNVKATLTK